MSASVRGRRLICADIPISWHHRARVEEHRFSLLSPTEKCKSVQMKCARFTCAYLRHTCTLARTHSNTLARAHARSHVMIVAILYGRLKITENIHVRRAHNTWKHYSDFKLLAGPSDENGPAKTIGKRRRRRQRIVNANIAFT